MDYRELLLKYIQHIVECDGDTYIHEAWKFAAPFSEEQWAELKRLKAESRPWGLR